MSGDREFFVGYLPAPAGARRLLRRAATGIGGGAVAAALALAFFQGPFVPSTFEFGHPRPASGTVARTPYPVLDGEGGSTPLVGEGKHGADAEVSPYVGHEIALEGTSIRRKGTEMLEIVSGSIVPGEGAPASEPEEDLGTTTLSGEIVDSKCFLGVMNPGNLETHRACAIACIRGGIPPMLYAHDRAGREAHVLLVDADGGPMNARVLPLVARPVTVAGRLSRRGGILYLRATSITPGSP